MKSFTSLFLLSLAALLSLSRAFAPPSQDCVLDATGKQTCTPSQVLDAVVRSSGQGPCGKRDEACWCEMVKVYTNQVRQKYGVNKMLRLGTKKQMANANRYAQKLSSMGRLVHQALPQVTKEVGCKRWVGGENLAYNYDEQNVARACVDQWIKSKGHFQNLIRDWFEEVVTGFHWDKDGRVYCVQTFSMYYPVGTFGNKNGPGCGPVNP